MSKHRTSLSQLPRKLLNHLRVDLEALSSTDAIHECGDDIISRLSVDPDAIVILAHKKLHVYPFVSVPTCWRRAYEEASLWQVVKLLEQAMISGRKAERHAERPGAEMHSWIDDVVRLCDMALIMTGGPGREKCITWMLKELEEGMITSGTRADEGDGDDVAQCEPPRKRMKLSLPPPKHIDIEDGNSVGLELSGYQCPILPLVDEPLIPEAPVPQSFPTSNTPWPRVEHAVPRLKYPSLDTFRRHMQDQRRPVILTRTIDHWPALVCWNDPRYWMRRTIGGRRLVPIELGRSYTDEGWGQKIVPFGEFLQNGLLREDNTERRGTNDGEEGNEDEIPDNTGDFDPVIEEDNNASSADRTSENDLITAYKKTPAHKDPRQVYLAQHDLLSQIPALRNDIAIPDYCFLPSSSRSSAQKNTRLCPDTTTQCSSPSPPPSLEPLLNIWLGPASTMSPCHTDPHHNILAQVFGRKYVRLFSPEESSRMYPMGLKRYESVENHGDHKEAGEKTAPGIDGQNENEDGGINMSNTSQVDVSCFLNYGSEEKREKQESRRCTQLSKYPLFEKARYMEGILEPGECLYIPPGWWHYVQSLSVSCSVSFWWD